MYLLKNQQLADIIFSFAIPHCESRDTHIHATDLHGVPLLVAWAVIDSPAAARLESFASQVGTIIGSSASYSLADGTPVVAVVAQIDGSYTPIEACQEVIACIERAVKSPR